ncbi:MAG: DUF2997 domain-containing protein [Deltaproteobacteria bacterium]
MANAQEIELFIDENGELKVHIKGIKGSGCAKVVDGLVKAMGPEKSRELTPEYYEKPQTSTGTNQSIGQ